MVSSKSNPAGLPKTAAHAATPATAASSASGGMVLERERLHALIDARLPGAVWLHGPTGAGKTLLLRSWLQHDRCPSIWLTVDERHRDPAALFAAITALAATHCRGPLPAFSPEHREDPGAFAEGYFARLDEELAVAHAIVLDDVHHLAGPTTPLLAYAVDAFEGRRKLCFASQLMPDAHFAPQLAGSRLWIVGHRLLAFDRDEASALAGRIGADTRRLEALVAATDGWAAGLMLAMQFGASGGTDDGSGDPLEAVRTPLALLIGGQVLGGVSKDELVRLRLMAEISQVPIDLADVAPEWAPACGRLQALSERGLFVERLVSEQKTVASEPPLGNVTRISKGCWRLHDLFRNALREPSAIAGPNEAMGERLVAHLLDVDRLDLAWQLASTLGPTSLDVLVRTHGSLALRDSHLLGLVQTAHAHVDRSVPAIAVWQARALIGNDSAGALRACEEAFAGFEASHDEAGMAQSIGLALFIVFATIENVGEIAVWADRFKVFTRPDLRCLGDPESRAIRVAGEVVYDMLIGGRAEGVESTLQDLLMLDVSNEILSANETILAGSLLVTAMRRASRIQELEIAVVRIEGLASYRRSAPHVRAAWNIENGHSFTRLHASDQARRCFEEALVLADENALVQPRIGALIGLVRLALGRGELKQGHELLLTLEGIDQDRVGRQRGWIVHLRARHEMLAGRAMAALALVDKAEQLVFDAGFPQSAKAILEKDRIQVLYGADKAKESAALARRVIETCAAADVPHIELTDGLLQSHALWNEDRPRAEQMLATHIGTARKLNVLAYLNLLPQVASHVAAEALRANQENDFVVRSIKSRNLPAPRNAPKSWPWPIRVEVLRAFRILRDTEPLLFSGKAQQKPLELLKYLVCTRDLVADSTTTASALWPDAEEGAARKSLEVTVSRLRKLLGDDSLVIVKEGKVSLDEHRVSSDLHDFTKAVAEAESVASGRYRKLQVVELGDELLRLFEALPLEQEEPTAWREAVRERHRAAFLRATRTLIAYWEGTGDAVQAIFLIEAALARDPLSETLYRLLMQIHIDAGNPTEAMRIYRQCRQMLSVLIGTQPSVDTERLKKSIQL